MTMDGFATFLAPTGPKVACEHAGNGKHCTKCGDIIHPNAKALGPRACGKRHEALCLEGMDHCQHCGVSIIMYRFFQVP